MHKILKVILKICCLIMLLDAIMPSALSEYFPFYLLSVLGSILLYTVGALAIAAYVIPMVSKRKPTSDSTLVIHDLSPGTIEELFPDAKNTKFFCASRKIAHCSGHYACWLKSPGVCALHDGVENLGDEISNCGTLIIISKSLYGGLGVDVKSALDRSISFALPFFHVRNKELHHQVRYKQGGTLQAYIYNSDELGQGDKDAIDQIIRAIGVNMDKHSCETVFVGDTKHLSEVLA